MPWSFAFWKPGAGAVTVSYATDEPTNDASDQPSSPETDRNERLGSKCLPRRTRIRSKCTSKIGAATFIRNRRRSQRQSYPATACGASLLAGLPAGRHGAGGNHRHETRHGRSSKSMANWPEDENHFSLQRGNQLPRCPHPLTLLADTGATTTSVTTPQ